MDTGVDWSRLLWYLIRIAAAYGLALPDAWDREKESRGAGLRTFPLVAVATCGYLLVAETVMGRSSEAQARVLEGLITGMGFIGGGAILKRGTRVSGTATAASLWTTGAIGAAAAYGRFEIAFILGLINLATLRFLAPLKKHLREEHTDLKG
jgi:putative Mg2+ transporter-C (MgtC) family protein